MPFSLVALPVYTDRLGTRLLDSTDVSDRSILVKLVGSDIVDGEDELDVVALCLFDEASDLF
jgi:hypothetical protein